MSLTCENGKIFRYAQGRRLPASLVGAYTGIGETITGFGTGGSESMTMFVRRRGAEKVTVRKILSEALTTVGWDPQGTGVMLPPFTKARKQAEYLRALPNRCGGTFPSSTTSGSGKSPPRTMRPGAAERLPGGHLRDELRTGRRGKPVRRKAQSAASGDRAPLRGDLPGPGAARYTWSTALPHQGTRWRSPTSKRSRTAWPCAVAPPREPSALSCSALSASLSTASPISIRRGCWRSSGATRSSSRSWSRASIPWSWETTNTENIKIVDSGPLIRAQRLINARAAAEDVNSALSAITAESVGLRFLDPRAIGFNTDGAHTRDDPMYDNKPWHNCLGHYDEIHYEMFDLRVLTGVGDVPHVFIDFQRPNPYQRTYEGMEEHFGPVMTAVYDLTDPESDYVEDDPYWLFRFVFMMGTHLPPCRPSISSPRWTGRLVDTFPAQRAR